MPSKPTGDGVALIEAFLFSVEKGQIVESDPGKGGPSMLGKVTTAFRAVLDGAKFDEAFGVEWKEGNPGDDMSRTTAYIVHHFRIKKGAKWASVPYYVNEWRVRQGLKPLKEGRLKNLYYEHKASIEAQLAFEEMTRELP